MVAGERMADGEGWLGASGCLAAVFLLGNPIRTPVSDGTWVSCMSGMWWAPIPKQQCPWFCLPALGKGLPPCPGARQGSSHASSLVPAGGSPAHMVSGAPTGLSICSMDPSFPAHVHHRPGQALGFLLQQGRSWADSGAGGAAGLGAPV